MPFMRSLGYAYKTSLYTSLLVELLARLANTIQFIMNIDILWGYIGWFTLFATVGCFLAVVVGRRLVEKYNLRVTMLIVVFCLMVSAVVTTITLDSMSIINDFKSGKKVIFFDTY